MSRDGGFEIADVDVGILDDPKWKKLARGIRDEATIARCFVAYSATMLGSWADGDRVTVGDAAPAWLTDLEDLEAHLRTYDLVDDQGKVLEHAFASWFGPAHGRREVKRERWRRGAEAKRGKRVKDAAPGDVPLAPEDPDRASSAQSPRGHDADPAGSPRPSVPSAPSVPPRPTGPSESSTRPRGSLERLGAIVARSSAPGLRGGSTT